MINDSEYFNSLTFFFPYKEVSGVPILFSRLALFLSENTDLQINVVDYADGALGMEVSSDRRINHITFSDGIDCEIPENTVLIFQSFLPSRFRNELKIKPKTRILFWTLHQDNLVPVLLPFPKVRLLEVNSFWFYETFVRFLAGDSLRKTLRLVDLLKQHSALYFMDSSTKGKTCKYLFLEIKTEDYIPVPALSVTERKNRQMQVYLNFGWVGRLCDFKSYILMYTIQRVCIYALESRKKIIYHVVGDGEFFDKIASCYEPNEYFELKMHGALAPNRLDDFLLENIDILTAMGTSVLEGAKLGIPSIVLDISYKPIKEDYLYRWVFETKNFDLAHQITNDDFSSGNKSLESMIKSIEVSYDYFSKNSLEYFNTNHSISAVAKKLHLAAKKTSLEFGNIDSHIFKMNFARKGYNRIKGYK